MERETRYTVLKISDIDGALSTVEKEVLVILEEKIDTFRRVRGKQPLKCVVVEHDWPEYEPTWAAIEKRVAREALPEWFCSGLPGTETCEYRRDHYTCLKTTDCDDQVPF
jgi:hypothetical protein